MRLIFCLLISMLLGACSIFGGMVKTPPVFIPAPEVVMEPPPSPVAAPPRPAPLPKPVKASSGSDITYNEMISPDGSGPTIVTRIVIGRAYLYPTEELSVVSANFIFFPKRPVTKSEQEQYEFVCKIWQASFPEMSTVLGNAADLAGVKLVPMYWPLKVKTKNNTCAELVVNYDYDRVQLFAAKNNLDPTKVWILCKLKVGLIVMNISSIDKQGDLENAMDVWRIKMCRAPKYETVVYAYDLVTSAKQVLGALESLIAFK